MAKQYNNSSKVIGNWEIQTQRPLDDRSVVKTKADLTDLSTWRGSDGNYYHYKGMLVSLANTGDIYVYTGESGSVTDVVAAAKWIKVNKIDFLHKNNTLYPYGSEGLQIANFSGLNTEADGFRNPTNDWWHHLYMHHANNNGYVVDLALAFHQNEIKLRRLVNGNWLNWIGITHPTVISEANGTIPGGVSNVLVENNTIFDYKNTRYDTLHINSAAAATNYQWEIRCVANSLQSRFITNNTPWIIGDNSVKAGDRVVIAGCANVICVNKVG